MPVTEEDIKKSYYKYHGLDNLRYTIWDHEDHYRAETMQKEKGRDPLLSYKERYWDTTHLVKEFTNLAALLPKIFPEERDNF